jgi:flagellar hook-associated protein 3 FlgL
LKEKIMTRVATLPLQHMMANAMQRSQQALAESQMQLSSRTRTPDLAHLGTGAVRDLSAHSMLAQQDSYGAVAKSLGTTLSFYDQNISSLETVGNDLKQSLLVAIGTNDGTGLKESLQAAFDQYRTALNAAPAGVPLFGGAQIGGDPFKPATLADVVGLPPANAFANDNVLASARVADQVDVRYGVTASQLGTDMFSAFRTLAEAGSIGNPPTATQLAALKTASDQLDTALGTVRTLNAQNGRNQAQVSTLETRAEERTTLLKNVIGDNEDADLGQVATDIAEHKMILEASYSVFAQLSSLNLSSYLR